MSDDQIDNTSSVFVSYSSKDREFVDELVISLKTNGFSVEIDREDLFPGEKWQSRLEHLIAASDTTLCILSPAWIASKPCKNELDIAIAQGRRIIPVIIAPVSPTDLPEALSERHFVIFHGADRSYAGGVRDLVNALRTKIEWVRQQTRLLDKANEWLQLNRSSALLLNTVPLERAKQWVDDPEKPGNARVAPLVSEYIAASIAAADDSEKRKLRNRFTMASLGGVALASLLGLSIVLLRGQLQKTEDVVEKRTEELKEQTRELGDLEGALEDAQQRRGVSAEGTEFGATDAAPLSPVDAPPSTSPETDRTPAQHEPNSELERLVWRLDNADRSTRLSAGQEVTDLIRASPAHPVLDILVSQLEEPRINEIGASGRFNVLYMLNVKDDWAGSPLAPRLETAVRNIRARAEGGIRIGGQTADCLASLEAKLAGKDGRIAGCGGV